MRLFYGWLILSLMVYLVYQRNCLDQQKRGLTIRFCEDLKAHKKYYYAFKEYPDDIVITVDDDVIYPQEYNQGSIGSA